MQPDAGDSNEPVRHNHPQEIPVQASRVLAWLVRAEGSVFGSAAEAGHPSSRAHEGAFAALAALTASLLPPASGMAQEGSVESVNAALT